MFGGKAISMTGTLVMLSIAATTNLWAQTPPTPLGAMVPLTLVIKATATVEGIDNGGSPIDKISASSEKINTQTILNLIAAANSIAFPPKATLVLQGGDLSVVDSLGNVLLDLTQNNILTITTDPDSLAVFQGQSNSKTGAANYTGAYIAVVAFNDGNGNTFNFTGLVAEKYSLSATDTNSNQKATDSITITAVGDGTINGVNAAFSATVTGSGKGVVAASGRQYRR